jgi:hypothetical protein
LGDFTITYFLSRHANSVVKAPVGSEESESETDVEEVEVHAGWNTLKGQWVMLQFIPSVATNKKGDPVWKWKCNWCE